MGGIKGDRSFFTESLLRWNKEKNKRQMPWKGVKDPYRIWLSEVILQQTRVEQGWAYYERIVSKYPAVQDLASAPDNEVFKLWEGLGYYSRCRNLLFTARFIAFERGGVFPSTYHDIAGLKGVGPYTAAAIASFAYDLPHAVVDGNVIRVLSRFFGISSPVDHPATRKQINDLADELISRQHPAAYNQALMDLGATICKPRSADCESCPLVTHCKACQLGTVEELPVKSKKPAKKKRYFHYIVFHYKDKVFLRKREGKDIWKDLFEFYLHEDQKLMDPGELIKQPFFREIVGEKYELVDVSAVQKQQLTHQDITGIFMRVKLKKRPARLEGYQEVDEKGLNRLAFPKFIVSYLREKM